MARNCGICSHEQREEINASLLSGTSLREISERFGNFSIAALHRHKQKHLPQKMVKAAEAAEVVEAGTLLDRLKALNRETAAILKEARGRNDDRALRAIARAEKQLELEARLLGELNEGVRVSLTTSPDWLATRSAILRAIDPYPEARRAVLEALDGLSV